MTRSKIKTTPVQKRRGFVVHVTRVVRVEMDRGEEADAVALAEDAIMGGKGEDVHVVVGSSRELGSYSLTVLGGAREKEKRHGDG